MKYITFYYLLCLKMIVGLIISYSFKFYFISNPVM